MRSSKGFTLTETMLTVLIVSILALVISPLLVKMTNFFKQTIARFEIERDARASLDLINRTVRQAQGGTVVLDQISGQPPWSRLSFTSINGKSISFYQTNNLLYIKVGSNSRVLSNRLAFISFVFPKTNDVTILSISMTMQSQTYLGGSKALQLFIQKVRLMN